MFICHRIFWTLSFPHFCSSIKTKMYFSNFDRFPLQSQIPKPQNRLLNEYIRIIWYTVKNWDFSYWLRNYYFSVRQIGKNTRVFYCGKLCEKVFKNFPKKYVAFWLQFICRYLWLSVQGRWVISPRT